MVKDYSSMGINVSYPNGLIGHLYGLIEGRHHDGYLLHESGLLEQLLLLPRKDTKPFCLYGDPAYPLSEHIVCPFRGVALSEAQEQFNHSMSAVRQTVEWSIGKTVTYFAFLDFKKNLKILLQPVGKYYKLGALLSNCHTCLYGSQTSMYFQCDPPSLQQYLNGIRGLHDNVSLFLEAIFV